MTLSPVFRSDDSVALLSERGVWSRLAEDMEVMVLGVGISWELGPVVPAFQVFVATDLAAYDQQLTQYRRQLLGWFGAVMLLLLAALWLALRRGLDPLRRMAGEGRAILFSSHILEEVERLAEAVLVVYAGRLAASGDFRSIRRLMTDRPHRFTIRSSDDRTLGAALLANPAVFGVDLLDGRLAVQASDLGAFARIVAPIARAAGIRLHELTPTDDTLESVFSYLVRR